jgi:hypothetical protein
MKTEQEETKESIKFYRSEQSLFCANLLYADTKTRIHRNMVLSVFHTGVKHDFFRLREVYKVGMFENWALKDLFVQNGEEVIRGGRKLHKEDIVTYTRRRTLSG